jgi:uncharacterized membrane protein YbhN (UPF0104 family)
VLGIVAVVMLGVICFLAFRRNTAMRLVDRLLTRAPESARPKLTEVAHSAIDGFGALTTPLSALELVGWSLAIWFSVGVVLFLGMNAFDLGLGFGAAMFIVVATTFGFFVPSSPGAFGVYHAIVINALQNVFDVPHAQAVSYALVIHLVFYLPPIAIGTLFLWRERRLWQRSSFLEKLRELRGSAAAAPEPQPGS